MTYRINGKTCVLIVPKGALHVDFRRKEYVEKITPCAWEIAMKALKEAM